MPADIKNLIEQSIEEINSKKKPVEQVLQEFADIIEKYNKEDREALNQQRLKEIQHYKKGLETSRDQIYTIRISIEDMSIKLIRELLRRTAEVTSNYLRD